MSPSPSNSRGALSDFKLPSMAIVPRGWPRKGVCVTAADKVLCVTRTRRSARAFNSKQRVTGRLTWALGTRKELEPVWRAYAATGQRNAEDHNARFVLVDPKGIQRVGYPLDKVTPERVAHDLRLLAAGK